MDSCDQEFFLLVVKQRDWQGNFTTNIAKSDGIIYLLREDAERALLNKAQESVSWRVVKMMGREVKNGEVESVPES